MTTSAITIVLVTDTIDELFIILLLSEVRTGAKILTPIHSKHTPLDICMNGIFSMLRASTISMNREKTDPITPMIIPFVRSVGGKLWHATAMITALSPPNIKSIRMTCRVSAQLNVYKNSTNFGPLLVLLWVIWRVYRQVFNNAPISDGLRVVRIPQDSNTSILASAVSDPPEINAPA